MLWVTRGRRQLRFPKKADANLLALKSASVGLLSSRHGRLLIFDETRAMDGRRGRSGSVDDDSRCAMQQSDGGYADQGVSFVYQMAPKFRLSGLVSKSTSTTSCDRFRREFSKQSNVSRLACPLVEQSVP